MKHAKPNSTFLKPPSEMIYRQWWAMLPAIPERKNSPAYRTLKRLWADHTMNTIRKTPDGYASAGSRGVYRTTTEDHLTMVLFENWELFPDPSWAGGFLAACGVDVQGEVSGIGWSYGFEEPQPKLIADLVVYFIDEGGEGVLVIEAKKPGAATVSVKDAPSTGYYFALPAIQKIARKYACLLLAEADREKVGGILEHPDEPILSWEQLAGLQIQACHTLQVPESVRSYLIGSLLHQYARYSIHPTPHPRSWLLEEPCADEIHQDNQSQSRSERWQPYWKELRTEK